MSEKYYNYNDLNQMQEKAKKIDSESDKKNFLRSMNPMEQKMALFYSRRPYEIINYLDSFDHEETNLMLIELNDEEISKLLEQFTAEDKKLFYSTFSNSLLVNRFISNDKNAFNHVDDLDLERKIELLDSSKKETQVATKEIYNSLSSEEKQEVEAKITSTEGSLIVDEVIKTSEVNLENTELEEQEIQENIIDEEKVEKEQVKEEKVEEETKEEQQENFKEINDFLKLRLQQYIQQNEKFKNLDIENPNLFSSLSDELKEIVVKDFNLLTEEQKNKLNNKEQQENLLNEFQKSKEECEAEVINNVQQANLKQEEEIINEKTNVLTL